MLLDYQHYNLLMHCIRKMKSSLIVFILKDTRIKHFTHFLIDTNEFIGIIPLII